MPGVKFDPFNQELKWEDVFNFLFVLQQTGVTNMLGAAPYLVKQFEDDYLKLPEAREWLMYWMENYETLEEELGYA